MPFRIPTRLVTLLGFVAAYVTLRVPLLLSSPRTVEPEELYIGTIATELSLGDAPVGFFELQYGHHDFGSLVNGVLAHGLYALLPPNAATLQLVGLFFACISLVASIYVARRLGGQAAAWITGLMLLLPPAFMIRASLSAQGNHGESIAFLVLAMALLVSPKAASVSRRFCLGTVLGFGMTYCFILVPFFAGLAFVPWLYRPPANQPPPSMRRALALALGLALGAAPWMWSATVAERASATDVFEALSDGIELVSNPTRDIASDRARKGIELFTQDLPATFGTRWPMALPMGPQLDADGTWGPAGREPLWSAASSLMSEGNSQPERSEGDAGGMAWYLLAIAGMAVLLRPGTWTPPSVGASGVVIALPMAGFILAWMLSRYGVEDLALRIYGDDEYFAYRYLAPFTHLLLLALGIATGWALTARARAFRIGAYSALALSLSLGAAATAAYLGDARFPWDPARVPAMAGTNYGALGRKIAADSREERARDLQQFMANEVVDLRRWRGFQRLAEWTTLRPGSEGRSMAAHYGWAVLQDDIPPEFAAGWLSRLHSLCPGLAEDARSPFCRNLHAGVPPVQGPAPSLPLPSQPHPDCIPSNCCRPAPSPAAPSSGVSPSPDAPRPITAAKAISG